jgi:hypothetical protein
MRPRKELKQFKLPWQAIIPLYPFLDSGLAFAAFALSA